MRMRDVHLIAAVVVLIGLGAAVAMACHYIPPPVWGPIRGGGETVDGAASTVLNLTAQIPEGLKAASVDFMLDDKVIVAGVAAPFTAKWDCAGTADGEHALWAAVTLEGGGVENTDKAPLVIEKGVPKTPPDAAAASG